MAAVELGIDPVEIRKQNFIPPERLPAHDGHRLRTTTSASTRRRSTRRAGSRATTSCAPSSRRAATAATRSCSASACRTYVEVTAGGLFQEYGAVEVNDDGTVTATVGTSVARPGPRDRVRDDRGRAARRPDGRRAARAVRHRGSSRAAAARWARARCRSAGSALCERERGGRSRRPSGSPRTCSRRTPTTSCSTRAGRSASPASPRPRSRGASSRRPRADPSRRPADWEGALAAELDFNQGDATYPFGAHIAVVEVDRETGRVELIRHVAVDDCGRILNPLLVAGQQHGGIAQGVAQALYEGVVYDDDGNPLTANLMDYAMPSAAELPSFEASNTETPTPLQPARREGHRRVGHDRLDARPCRTRSSTRSRTSAIRHIDMPLTAERVWQAIQDAQPPEPTVCRSRNRRSSSTLDAVPRRSSRTATTDCPTRRAGCSAGPIGRDGRADRRGRRRSTRAATPTRRRAPTPSTPRDLPARDARRRGRRRRASSACWHSHTHTDAYPSATDVRQARRPGVDLRDREPEARGAGAAGLPDRGRRHPRGRGVEVLASDREC